MWFPSQNPKAKGEGCGMSVLGLLLGALYLVAFSYLAWRRESPGP
ncbi:hypothetical protein [Thermus sp. LT1-2-5]